MERIDVPTSKRCELVSVTAEVNAAARALGVADGGAVLVHVPHTTAAITVNEGYDPDVASDLLRRLELLAPHWEDTAGGRDRHGEGNSDSHLKAALVGTSTLLPWCSTASWRWAAGSASSSASSTGHDAASCG